MQATFKGIEVPSGRFMFELSDGSRVVVRVKVEAGRIDFPSVEVLASDVDSDRLRDVPIGKLREEIRRQLAGNPSLADGWAVLAELHRGSGLAVPEPLAAAEKTVADAVENLRGRKGRPQVTDEFLRDVAIAWIAAVGVSPRGARRLLAREFGYSTDTVARWVRKARAAGWLAVTTPGRAGAELGPKLIEWRNSQEGNAQ